MATGDAHGVVKTWSLVALLQFWDDEGFESHPPIEAIESVAVWRGHSREVSSIAFSQKDEHIFMTSGFDNHVAMWSTQGAHVGTFGKVRSACGVRWPCTYVLVISGFQAHSACALVSES
jgi:WD40 repeat protein